MRKIDFKCTLSLSKNGENSMTTSLVSNFAPYIAGASLAAWDLGLIPKVVTESIKAVFGVIPAKETAETYIVSEELQARITTLAAVTGTLFMTHLIYEKFFKSPENPKQILPR